MANYQEGDDSYRQLLELEELESLQEEIEETGFDPQTQWADLPADLLERLASFGINNSSDLVTRIAYMHGELDEQ
ncbi:MAG: hypothetical protein M3441_03795 [Chloroflexota bacterium]|nr:hypothetical protein [Chloroflexota bacterium]